MVLNGTSPSAVSTGRLSKIFGLALPSLSSVADFENFSSVFSNFEVTASKSIVTGMSSVTSSSSSSIGWFFLFLDFFANDGEVEWNDLTGEGVGNDVIMDGRILEDGWTRIRHEGLSLLNAILANILREENVVVQYEWYETLMVFN